MALISMRQLLHHAAENDYGVSANVCERSMQMGFTSVMMDGSLLEDKKTPAEYGCNVDVTRRVVEMAHACGVSVEGELGCLGSMETGTACEEDGVWAESVLNRDQLLTDPKEAADFVAKTEVDALAIAIGTSHGAYKFSRPPSGNILAIDRIKAIHERLSNAHLVMHGSSSAPQDLLKEINECGGEIADTFGVPVQEIQQGIKPGVRKVNIDTGLRFASAPSIRRSPAENPAEFDPRKYLAVSQKAMKDVVVARYEAFDTAGNADKIHAKSPESMFMHYAPGEFTPLIA